jgi:hypothetical protein
MVTARKRVTLSENTLLPGACIGGESQGRSAALGSENKIPIVVVGSLRVCGKTA